MSNMKWSDEQEAVFSWFSNPEGRSRALVVRARAGTGKTTTIKAAFERAPEHRMLYAVFNKKNQVEADAKISDPRVQVKTLHSLGYAYVRRAFGSAKPDNRVEFDRVDKVCDLQASAEYKAEVRKLVSLAKNMLASANCDDLWQLASQWGFGDSDEEAGLLVRDAQKVLLLSNKPDAEGRISFDDMVYMPVAAGLVRPWFDMVVIDEAQDMSPNQLRLARGACRKGGRICIVGDDRQAIYGFRGADVGGMDRMEQELEAERLGLCVTFRCPKRVVELAAVEVPDYRAADGNPEGVVGSVSEANLLVEVVPGDAVLSRKNAPLMPLCLSLIRKGVPAMVEGRDVGKQLVGLVDKLSPRSVPDLFKRLDSWVDRQRARLGKMDEEAAEARMAVVGDQADTIKAVAGDAKSVQEVAERLKDLFQDSKDQRRPMVVLSSVHKAKGLEWDRVFMLSDTFRASKGGEEANIYYVAVTRAKRELYGVQP